MNKGVLARGILVVMLLLPVSAGATEWLGVHALFGAFFAGLIMPRHERLTRALSGKVEPAVVSLLLPIFFGLSGLCTSISVVRAGLHTAQLSAGAASLFF